MTKSSFIRFIIPKEPIKGRICKIFYTERKGSAPSLRVPAHPGAEV